MNATAGAIDPLADLDAPDRSDSGAGTADADEALDTSHLSPPLVPLTVARMLDEPAVCLAADPAPSDHLRLDPPASFGGTAPVVADEYPELFSGSRPYVQYRLPGEHVPSRVRLEQSVVDELVEHWYRSEPGWRLVDRVTSAVSSGGQGNESLASQLEPSDSPPDVQPIIWPLRSRGEEARAFERMSAAAQRKLAPGIAWHLVQAEDWARAEVLRRLSESTRTVAGGTRTFRAERALRQVRQGGDCSGSDALGALNFAARQPL